LQERKINAGRAMDGVPKRIGKAPQIRDAIGQGRMQGQKTQSEKGFRCGSKHSRFSFPMRKCSPKKERLR
jgi:hypothetical protein